MGLGPQDAHEASPTVFLKLGGSLITDKAQPETARADMIARLAKEIATALKDGPQLRLLIGHGSGSFGHTAGQRYGTRQGVSGAEAWRGFAKVSLVAGQLNQLVLEALDAAALPVLRLQPSASTVCRGGHIMRMETLPIERALDEGLIPLVHGDVAIDETQGGTIISTEDVFEYLARALRPRRILLAGDYDGVLDADGRVVQHITPAALETLRDALGSSAHTDVTGGMASKVASMLALCEAVPGLEVWVFNGQREGAVRAALLGDWSGTGTRLTAT